MKVRDLIKILADQEPNSEIYIDFPDFQICLEEEHIEPAKPFSSFKETRINLSNHEFFQS